MGEPVTYRDGPRGDWTPRNISSAICFNRFPPTQVSTTTETALGSSGSLINYNQDWTSYGECRRLTFGLPERTLRDRRCLTTQSNLQLTLL